MALTFIVSVCRGDSVNPLTVSWREKRKKCYYPLKIYRTLAVHSTTSLMRISACSEIIPTKERKKSMTIKMEIRGFTTENEFIFTFLLLSILLRNRTRLQEWKWVILQGRCVNSWRVLIVYRESDVIQRWRNAFCPQFSFSGGRSSRVFNLNGKEGFTPKLRPTSFSVNSSNHLKKRRINKN